MEFAVISRAARKIFSAVKNFLRKEILRTKIKMVYRESFKDLSIKIPQFSPAELEFSRKKLDEFFDKNPDISQQELQVFVQIVPLVLSAIQPRVDEKSLRILFEIVLEELRNSGRKWNKNPR